MKSRIALQISSLQIQLLSLLIGVTVSFFTQASDGCSALGIKVNATFEGARVDHCIITKTGAVRINIEPENEPINNSPWYGFSLRAETPQTVPVSIHYRGGSQRYLPKISRDDETWQVLPHRVNNNVLHFSVEANTQPAWIAGQELILSDDYASWNQTISEESSFELSLLGQSAQGRAINKLVHNTNGNEWVIIIGRQHPPEVTGAMALFPFVQALIADSADAEAFRTRFNILLVPFLNPDGVYAGNWRHNANGFDLNRDWGKFEQPETRLVGELMAQIIQQGGRFVYGLDFHSTQRDVFYTMPEDYPLKPAGLTRKWLDSLQQLTPDFDVVQQPGTSPGRGIFKQFMADLYQVHSVTYEMGDNTDREVIGDVAVLAANSFMRTLLDTPDTAFEPNPE